LATKKAKPAKPAEKRVRRSPEEARTLILDAADRVFRTHLPDSVGLKEIARVVHAAVLGSPEARWPDLGEVELGLVMSSGFGMANAPLYKASLAPVSQSTRADVAPPATIPAHWQDLLRR
jgi:hypothetical protein